MKTRRVRIVVSVVMICSMLLTVFCSAGDMSFCGVRSSVAASKKTKDKRIPIAAGAFKFDSSFWNDDYWVGALNCYSYAFNLQKNPISAEPYDFPDDSGTQPGYYANVGIGLPIYEIGITKANVMKRVRADMKRIGYKIKEIKGNGVYKKQTDKKTMLVYLQVSKYEQNRTIYDKKKKIAKKYYADYHWYRQDSDGYWSHKRGSKKVSRRDSDGKKIINPQGAQKIYKLKWVDDLPYDYHNSFVYEIKDGILYKVYRYIVYDGEGAFFSVKRNKKWIFDLPK